MLYPEYMRKIENGTLIRVRPIMMTDAIALAIGQVRNPLFTAEMLPLPDLQGTTQCNHNRLSTDSAGFLGCQEGEHLGHLNRGCDPARRVK